MSDARIKLEIVTPEKLVYTAETTYIAAQGVMGQLGLLPNHAALVTALDIGALRVRGEKGEDETLFINGGFLEINKNHAVVLTHTAERREDIDVARAEQAKLRAEERLAQKSDSLDVDRAEAALKRAINRLKIAG